MSSLVSGPRFVIEDSNALMRAHEKTSPLHVGFLALIFGWPLKLLIWFPLILLVPFYLGMVLSQEFCRE